MSGPDNALELTDEGWGNVVDTDVRGASLGIQACLPTMLEMESGSS